VQIIIDGSVVASISIIELARGIVFCDVEDCVCLTDLLDDKKFFKAIKKFLKPFGINLLEGYAFRTDDDEIGFVAKEKNLYILLDLTLEEDEVVCIAQGSEIFSECGEKSILEKDRWVRLKTISSDLRRIYWRGHRTTYSTNLENVT